MTHKLCVIICGASKTEGGKLFGLFNQSVTWRFLLQKRSTTKEGGKLCFMEACAKRFLVERTHSLNFWPSLSGVSMLCVCACVCVYEYVSERKLS